MHHRPILKLRAQALADKKKVVEEEDIQALVNDELHQPESIWELLTLQVGLSALWLDTPVS